MFCGLLSTVIGTKKPLQIILPFCPYLCLDLAFIDHIVFRSTCFKYSWLPLVHRLFVTSPNLSGLILSFSVNTRLHIIRDYSFVEKRSQYPFFSGSMTHVCFDSTDWKGEYSFCTVIITWNQHSLFFITKDL